MDNHRATDDGMPEKVKNILDDIKKRGKEGLDKVKEKLNKDES